MTNRWKAVIIVSVITLIVILVVASRIGPKEPNWTPTFDETRTKPLDTKVFFEQLPSWFTDGEINKVSNTFYEYVDSREYAYELYDYPSNYIHVSREFYADNVSVDYLLEYVRAGSTAFISAYDFSDKLLDSLNIEIEIDIKEFNKKEHTVLDLTTTGDCISFESKLYSENDKYIIKKELTEFEIEAGIIEPEISYTELGFYKNKTNEKRTNFIVVPLGDGQVFLHTNPEIFTNYQLLKAQNFEYINRTVSYLPNQDVLFDQRVKINPEISRSPLRYILSQPALAWAWYLTLVSILLFIVFNSRRRQRIIPVIPPIVNTTTDFVKTMSNFYLGSSDKNSIIQKKIIFFLEHIRTEYGLSTQKLNEDLIHKLSHKTNYPIEKVRDLITTIEAMQKHHFTTVEPLINLHKKIEAFYKR